MASHWAGAGSPRIRAASVAFRSASDAPPFVNTPSSTPFEYSSGPATSRIDHVPSPFGVARLAQNSASPRRIGQCERSQAASPVAR